MTRIGALLLFAGCGASLGACRAAPDDAPSIDSSNPLEVAARNANLVDDPATTPPTGLFERRHSSGADGLCLRADGSGYRFGLVASFGSHLTCEGAGHADQSGARLTLRFDGADCTIGARYDGRSIRVDGQVPAGCAALCGQRSSMSGVAVDRVGWTQADARRLVSRTDTLAGRSPRRLCE